MATVEPVYAFYKTDGDAETDNATAEKILCEIVIHPSRFMLIPVQTMNKPPAVSETIPARDLPGLKRRKRLFGGS